MKVPIQNIYYLLCFAWRFIPEDLAIDVGAIDSPDAMNLCAHVLTDGIDRLLRRGIDQGYITEVDETPRLRGRIDVTSTITRLSWLHARAVCHFDELTPNILQNRILRTTIRLLLNANIEQRLRNRVHETDRRLSGIEPITLNASLFHRVQLHRNNSFYAFLMRICELVHLSMLPDQTGQGRSSFRDILSDETLMATVFEEFVRNFYSLKQSRFTVSRSYPQWQATAVNGYDLNFLPKMTTDVTLSSVSRMIIIDAKYYREALQANYGKRTVHSGNLYQLMAYLRGTLGRASVGQVPEGILLYPAGEVTPDLRYTIDGFPVRICTVNLNQPWREIEQDLFEIIR